MQRIISLAIASGAIALISAGGVSIASTAGSNDARIPFASNVRDFQADGTDAIYIQDVHRTWYHGTFMAPCLNLPFAETIGFNDRGTGGLDKWGTIYIRGDRCQLRTFVKSGPPPKKLHKAKGRPSPPAA